MITVVIYLIIIQCAIWEICACRSFGVDEAIEHGGECIDRGQLAEIMDILIESSQQIMKSYLIALICNWFDHFYYHFEHCPVITLFMFDANYLLRDALLMQNIYYIINTIPQL